MLAIAALTALSLPAYGQEPDIVDACVAATAHFYQVDEIEWSAPQAFPELDPPRVRMQIKIPAGGSVPGAIGRLMFGQDAPAEKETYAVKCAFESAETPFGLIEFAPPDWELGVRSDRLEELRVLLEREGY